MGLCWHSPGLLLFCWGPCTHPIGDRHELPMWLWASHLHPSQYMLGWWCPKVCWSSLCLKTLRAVPKLGCLLLCVTVQPLSYLNTCSEGWRAAQPGDAAHPQCSRLSLVRARPSSRQRRCGRTGCGGLSPCRVPARSYGMSPRRRSDSRRRGAGAEGPGCLRSCRCKGVRRGRWSRANSSDLLFKNIWHCNIQKVR